jgi:hypothetical protein
MNRLGQFFEEPARDEPADDYCTVETQCESFPVSRAVAEDVERALEHGSLASWIVFKDLTGARHRLRARLIERVSECLAAQRAARRAFYRERRREAKADREPWEDD